MSLARKRPLLLPLALSTILVYHSAFTVAQTSVISSLTPDLDGIASNYNALSPMTEAAKNADGHTSTKDQAEALAMLGKAFLYGDDEHNTPLDRALAFRLYEAASHLGSPEAHFHIGVAYAYGLWGYQHEPARATTHYYFAALDNHVGAQLALGFRHLYGRHTPKNCESAIRYYAPASDKAVELRELSIGSPALHDVPARRLQNVADAQHKQNEPTDDAIVEYYEFSAAKGDPDATITLATFYYYGARGVEQDMDKAAGLFQKAYDLGASGSAYHLGHAYHQGLGVHQDNATAEQLLEEAVEEGSAAAQNELGMMMLEGRSKTQWSEGKRQSKALDLFKASAKQGHMEAFYNLGVLHLQGAVSAIEELAESGHKIMYEPEYEVALGYFQLAAHQGHTLSSHKLAHMHWHGIGTGSSCSKAVELFKTVAERGEWKKTLSEAYEDFSNKKYEAAFVKYAVMAQQGYEVAQHNAAFLLNDHYVSSSSGSTGALSSAAIILYKLAAMQGNVDANLKLGDFFYYGRGGSEVDLTKASAHYSLAGKKANAQALFNLGIMYEHGIGQDQDFFLAKRFYDRSRIAHADAHVPATLALWKLYAHMTYKTWWTWLEDWWNGELKEKTSPAVEASYPSYFGQWWTVDVQDTSMDSALQQVWSVFQTDILLILGVAIALGVVMYIRSERQNQMDGRRQVM